MNVDTVFSMHIKRLKKAKVVNVQKFHRLFERQIPIFREKQCLVIKMKCHKCLLEFRREDGSSRSVRLLNMPLT